MRTHLLVSIVSILTGASACASSQAEQVKDARMEQTEARAQADENAIEQRSASREDAVERAYDSQEQNIAAANQPGENASQQLVEVSKDRAIYQSEAETRLDKLGVRIDAATEKLTVLGSRAPTSLKTELKTATQEYNMLKQDVSKLDKTPTTDWEPMTTKLEDRMTALDSRVDDLTESIEDV